MATKSENEHLHEIDKNLAVLATEFKAYRRESLEKRKQANDRIDEMVEETDSLKREVDKIFKIVTNGLTHKINELYDSRNERRKTDTEHAHDIKLLGVKMTQERRNQVVVGIVNGLISGVFMIIVVLLSR